MADKMMRRIVDDMGRVARERRRAMLAGKGEKAAEKAADPVEVDAVIETSGPTPEELEQILAGAK